MDLQKIAIRNHNFTNWSRTFQCKPELYFVPETVEEIREILFLAKSENKRIRVVGCGNSPSDICCSNDYMLDMVKFDKVLHVDRVNKTVHVQGGIKLYSLNHFLEENGLAMPILGSISDSTISGVISVGTHGTGANIGIIADYILEIRVIVPSGDVLVCSPSEQVEIFRSVLCGLGALGVILEVTIQCEPRFYLHQFTYPSTLDRILDSLDENVESCDHFRFLWFPHTDYVSVSITNKINGKFLQLNTTTTSSSDIGCNKTNLRRKFNLSSSTFECRPKNFSIPEDDSCELTTFDSVDFPLRLDSDRHWFQKTVDWIVNYGFGYHVLQFAYWISTYIPALVPAINRTAFWLLYSGNRVSLDISYKIFNFECLFDQYVNEWSIPRNKTADVLRNLRETIENATDFRAHFPVEVRFARASEIYLSPTYGRDSTYINIICYRPYRKLVEHQRYWDEYERIVKAAGGRPHWAKAHRETGLDFVRMYPYFRAWIQVRRRLDPYQLFSNQYLDRVFNTPNLISSSTTTTTTTTTITAANVPGTNVLSNQPHNNNNNNQQQLQIAQNLFGKGAFDHHNQNQQKPPSSSELSTEGVGDEDDTTIEDVTLDEEEEEDDTIVSSFNSETDLSNITNSTTTNTSTTSITKNNTLTENESNSKPTTSAQDSSSSSKSS